MRSWSSVVRAVVVRPRPRRGLSTFPAGERLRPALRQTPVRKGETSRVSPPGKGMPRTGSGPGVVTVTRDVLRTETAKAGLAVSAWPAPRLSGGVGEGSCSGVAPATERQRPEQASASRGGPGRRRGPVAAGKAACAFLTAREYHMKRRAEFSPPAVLNSALPAGTGTGHAPEYREWARFPLLHRRPSVSASAVTRRNGRFSGSARGLSWVT